MSDSLLISPKQASEFLGVSLSCFYRNIYDAVPARAFGGKVMFLRDEIETYARVGAPIHIKRPKTGGRKKRKVDA